MKPHRMKIDTDLPFVVSGLDSKKNQEQLERLKASPDFKATPQQRKFLDFIVSETLAGNTNEIKGYTVATRVFGPAGKISTGISGDAELQKARAFLGPADEGRHIRSIGKDWGRGRSD